MSLRHALVTAFAAALLGLTLTACLEARPGLHVGQADTTGLVDTLGGDVSDPCAGKVCDDGDPCTEDWCDPGTGACAATPLGKKPGPAVEPPECAADGDCDDDDACTADVCVARTDCGEVAWAYCTHTPRVGCGGCQLAGCDDGDPCTGDVCHGDGSCGHDLQPGCGGGCSGLSAIGADVAAWTAWPGEPVTLAGVAASFPADAVCYATPFAGRAQDPCYTCSYPIGLAATVYAVTTVRLAAPALWGDGMWACTEGCAMACTPLLWGAAYWVWGTATSSYDVATGAAPGGEAPPREAAVRPPADGLDVADWCLQTNLLGLPGMYQGEVKVDGFDRPLPFVVEIGVENGALLLTFAPSQCTDPGCPQWIHEVLGPQTVPLEAGDGTVSFKVEMVGLCQGPTTSVRVGLASHRNTLSGSFADAALTTPRQPAELAWCSHGTVVLTRQP